ncbi:MAG TPA: T9SS type A sorting domain-containing protein [Chitinophagales bacterium]|nr:T9SS type A sorting domain-containing protein [Chitinophagales bacterium]
MLNDAVIVVTNMLGQTVIEVPVVNATTSTDVSSINSGVYFYDVKTKQGSKAGKVVIER